MPFPPPRHTQLPDIRPSSTPDAVCLVRIRLLALLHVEGPVPADMCGFGCGVGVRLLRFGNVIASRAKGPYSSKIVAIGAKKWPTENGAMLYGLPSAGPLIGSRHRSAAPTTTVLRRSALLTSGHQNFFFPNHPARRSGLCLDTAGLSGLYRSCSSWRDGPRCFAKSISSFCSRNKNLVQHGACHRVQLVRH
jgi:hypothetical protein